VSKAYPGVTALEDVSFSLRRGEIRALCGENGAGKSTLVKILMGLVAPDRGSIAINGQTQVMHSPQQAQGLGLGLVRRSSASRRICRSSTISGFYLTMAGRAFVPPFALIAAQ
jgi:ribose transport system ATP-binding protein